jgi:hypothetical protein
MMVTLTSGSAIAKEQRAKETEEARLAKEAKERRKENEKQLRLLVRVTEFLTEQVKKHELLEKIMRLEEFLDLGSTTSEDCPFPELKSVFDFVLTNLRHQISAKDLNREIVDTRLLDKERWH